MSKKDFNPYRDLLNIPSLQDEEPTDYQLLGVDDFESDSGKIAAGHEKRMQRIAELYRIVTEMSNRIDAARDRISDAKTKEDYDYDLRRTGRAGTPHLGKAGSFAVFFSFVLSIFIVVISTFYIYPMVVALPAENIGDSVTTLPDYNEDQTQKEIDILKEKQEDILTMDVNFSMPIDVDADSSVELLDVPAEDIHGVETTLDDLPVSDVQLAEDEPAADDSASPAETLQEDAPSVEQPAIPEVPAVEEPAVEQTAEPEEPEVPDVPAVEEPAVEQAAAPEEPAVPDVPAVEEPAVEQTAIPDEPAVPDVPDVEEPAVEQTAEPEEPTVPDVPAVEKPAVEQIAIPDEPTVPDVPAVEESAIEDSSAPETPSVEEPAVEKATETKDSVAIIPSEESSEIKVVSVVPERSALSSVGINSDTPTVPKMSDMDNSGIPELPPLEEIASSNPPMAPQPPVIPELASVPEPIVTHDGGRVLPAEKLPEASNEWRENASVTQNPLATPPNGIADRVGSQVEVDSAETGSFGGITPSTPPNGIVLEDVDKLGLFVQLGHKARTDSDFTQLLSSARQTEEELMKEKNFPKAQQIADVVYAYCARFADKSYRAEAYQHKEIVARQTAWWNSARAVEKKMETSGIISPAEANIVAQWKIQMDKDWEAGLKYLALSDNEQIKLAVRRDLAANPEDVRHCLIVANDWWNLAQDPVPMQKQYRQRACMWYSKALPSIEDKQIRTLVEKRISMVDQGFSKH